MTRALGPTRLGLWVAASVVVFALAPQLAPLDPSLHPLPDATAFGVLAGAALFAVLARRLPSWDGLMSLPRRRLAARSLVLASRSLWEEALWRGIVLGATATIVGLPAAVALSTALFAAAHAGKQGVRALTHLVTGAAFGAVYVTTGRLSAAAAAHGVYNVLVGSASLADRAPLSVLDTRSSDARLLRSTRSPRSRGRPMIESPQSSSTPCFARLDGVSKSFGNTCAVDGVDLELREGEILALLGPNGAGKTTAVAILLGLRAPDGGRAMLFGRDPRDPQARRGVGAVLQDVSFPPGLRVGEVVDLVRAHFPDARQTVDALGLLDLGGLVHRDAAGLSGGQKRRLAVALALAGRPRALFLDEPTAGMDPAARRSLLRDVTSFADQGGAVLLTTQQLSEAEEIATRVVVIDGGRIEAEGSVGEIKRLGGVTRVIVRAPRLPELPGALATEFRNGRHVVFVGDADAYVAALVRADVEFHDLEIVRSTLEDAVLGLTKKASGSG